MLLPFNLEFRFFHLIACFFFSFFVKKGRRARDHLFSTFEEFSEKTKISYPLIRTRDSFVVIYQRPI